VGLPTARQTVGLGLHLARREVRRQHADTLLGWFWPLARQLLQWVVLVAAFHVVLDLGIEHYPVFIFVGLVQWFWFSTALANATGSIHQARHFLLQPRFPVLVLPVAAVVAPAFDALAAVPIMLLMVELGPGLQATTPLLLVVFAAQLVLVWGAGWLLAPIGVFLRDLPHVVAAGLLTLFYLTPVFYPLDRAPESIRSWLELNPIGALIEQQRRVLIDGRAPDWLVLGAVVAGGLVLAALGAWLTRRTRPYFLEQL
jgi:lipopolysaccharide transport system permease protein